MHFNETRATPNNDAFPRAMITKSAEKISFLEAVSYIITECGQEITVPAHSSEIEVAGIDGNRSIGMRNAILAVHPGSLQYHCTSFVIVWSKLGGLLI